MLTVKFTDFVTQIKPYRQEIDQAIKRVIDSGWYILGNEVANFEQEFAKYLGSKYVIGVANGLEAIQISLMALGIGRGDEVITTPVSAVATTLAILAVGAKPVFVDVDKNGLIDLDLIEKHITKKTKALLPVHLYGNFVDVKELQRICHIYKLHLIEDAAQAHGSSYQNRKAGSWGIVGCFSFYPTKNLGALGDGGAVATPNLHIAKICQEIRDYGQVSKYIHSRYGLNSRLDELQAAILRVKLKYLDSENTWRRKIAQRYIANLEHLPQVALVKPIPNTISSYHQFAIRTNKRNQLRDFLKTQGVESLIHYPMPIPQQKFLKRKLQPNALKFTQEVLSLPCRPGLAIPQVNYICKHIKKFYDH